MTSALQKTGRDSDNCILTAILKRKSGTVIKFDNPDKNKLLANQTQSLSSRDVLKEQPSCSFNMLAISL